MLRTVEAIIDEKGEIHLLEKVELSSSRRALVTILDPDHSAYDDHEDDLTSLLSEPSLAQDWCRTEEDEAWSHLRPDPS